ESIPDAHETPPGGARPRPVASVASASATVEQVTSPPTTTANIRTPLPRTASITWLAVSPLSVFSPSVSTITALVHLSSLDPTAPTPSTTARNSGVSPPGLVRFSKSTVSWYLVVPPVWPSRGPTSPSP